MTNTSSGTTSTLTGAWTRLDAVCRRLWEENSTCAVETQAILEEFRGEVARMDAHFAVVDDQRRHEAQEHEERLASMRRHYEMETAGLKKRLELLEKNLDEKEMRIEELLKTLARKEEENLEFHSQVLRMSAASDEVKSKKMDDLYQELIKKEASLDNSWQQRHKTLEMEHKQTQEILAAKQAELTAWDQRRLSEEESLLKRQTDLEIHSQHLVQEYRKKQQEIEDLKMSLQKSVTDLVHQYQARIKGGALPPR